jgi:hypothetical protein
VGDGVKPFQRLARAAGALFATPATIPPIQTLSTSYHFGIPNNLQIPNILPKQKKSPLPPKQNASPADT